MKRLRTLVPAILVGLMFLTGPGVFSQGDNAAGETPADPAGTDATASLGYFSVSQVEPGLEVYEQHCAICHGYTLQSGEMGGPPLTGKYFFDRWSGRTVGELLEYIHTNMPFGQGGTLTTTQYENVTAYVLDFNDFPAGEAPIGAESAVLDQPIVQPEQEQE